MRQVVVNYAASAGPAQEVADAIKASGGDAIVVGADMSKKEDIDRCPFAALTCSEPSRPARPWSTLHNPAMLCTAVLFSSQLSAPPTVPFRRQASAKLSRSKSPLEKQPMCIKL